MSTITKEEEPTQSVERGSVDTWKAFMMLDKENPGWARWSSGSLER